MTIFEIFKTLRKHRKLAEKRSVSFEQNKAAKYLIWFVAAFVIIYLIFFAVMFALIANDSVTTTSVEFLFGLFPFILTLDFLFRFTAQQTPAQIVKPYVLLPLPRYACIDSFIGSSLFSGGNLIWFAMIAPYLLMSVAPVMANGWHWAYCYSFGCSSCSTASGTRLCVHSSTTP